MSVFMHFVHTYCTCTYTVHVLTSLVPRPLRVRRLQYEIRAEGRAWARSSRDACWRLRHVHSTGINDVIDELAPSLALKEAPPRSQ